MPRLFAVLGALSLVALAPRTYAGAWTQTEGGYYIKVAYAGLDSRTRFDAVGDRVTYQTFGAVPRAAEYRNREVRGYGEYGVIERLTAYGSLAYKRLAVEEQTAALETAGLGDLTLGTRWRLTGDGPPLALAAELSLPTGYATDDNPALGAGQTEAVLKGLAGVSGPGWYATGDLGWMQRGGGYRSQVVGSLEAGGRIARVGGRGVLRGARSLGRGSEAAGGGFDPARASPRVLTAEGALGFEVAAGVSLEMSLSRVLSGRDALAGNMVELSIARSGLRPR